MGWAQEVRKFVLNVVFLDVSVIRCIKMDNEGKRMKDQLS